MDLQLAEASRGGDGGAAGARDEGARDVIGKKTEGVVEELIVDASVADENMTRQESGVVGGVGSNLSITLQLQLQEHRLPVGHCQLVVRRRRRRWRLLGAPGRAALASRAVLDEGSSGYPPSLSPSLGYPPQLPKCLPPVVGGGGISGRPTNGRRVWSANGRDGLLQVIPMQADRAYCLLDTAGAWLSLLNEVDTCQK